MSDDNKLFRCAGVSDGKGGYKVRFAGDMTRVKVLMKTGNSDIELIELPDAMTKAEAVAYLKTTRLMERDIYRTAIENADAKYNSVSIAKTAKVSKPAKTVLAKTGKARKAAPNIQDIRARAQASSAPADMLAEALAALVAESQKSVNTAD